MTTANKQDNRTKSEITRAMLMISGFLISCGREQDGVEKLSQAIDMLDTIIADERALEEARRHILKAQIEPE
tara:strand:+ start:1677 stop:1892 length:216 start_codon:yes stop_codon:yes gene_type:complete